MAGKGKIMFRCKCGETVGGNDSSVKIKNKKTGKIIKVICAECVSKHSPKMVLFRKSDNRRARKTWERP